MFSQVFELADRLKYFDPALEKSLDDINNQQQLDGGNLSGASNLQASIEEQKWLQNLRSLAVQYNNNITGAHYAAGSTTDAQNYQLSQHQIDQQFVEINKQFNELNLQYNSSDANVDNVALAATAVPTFYNPDTIQQQQQAVPDNNNEQQLQQQQLQQDYDNQQQQLYNASNTGLDYSATAAEPPAADAYYAQQQYMQPDSTLQQQQNSYYDPTQQYNANANLEPAVDASNASYDYWQQQQQMTAMGEEVSNCIENNYN